MGCSTRMCNPTVGTMQASYAAFMLVSNLDPKRDTLCLSIRAFRYRNSNSGKGHKYASFDVYNYAESLTRKARSYLGQGNIIQSYIQIPIILPGLPYRGRIANYW
jgi:hypothetical protein